MLTEIIYQYKDERWNKDMVVHDNISGNISYWFCN